MRIHSSCAAVVLSMLWAIPQGVDGSSRPAAKTLPLPPSAQSNISAAVGRDIPAYHARTVGRDVELANPSQRLVARFTSEAVEMTSGGTLVRLAFRGYGYGNKLKQGRQTAPQPNLNRVEYCRGPLTEWYVNGPSGLEQGFTLQEPPGVSEGQPLTVAVEAPAGSTATIEGDRSGMTLRGPDGAGRLRYRGLIAYDANARLLRSWLEFREGRMLLEVDDAGARYPVVIDPWVQVAELTASDGRGYDNLGYSMAVSGNTVVVGAPGATVNGERLQGAAYVFVQPKTGWGNMTQTAKLTASDGTSQDDFGTSVSVDANTIVVGAPYNDRLGAAYVFIEPVGGWTNMTQTVKLTASDATAFDYFGYSVSVSDNTVVVGEPRANVVYAFQGAAYVFVKPGKGWRNMTQTAKLTASNGGSDDVLGSSVAVNGNVVVAGAPGWPSGLSQGSAYLFVEPAKGWQNATQTGQLSASDGQPGDELGFSTSFSSSAAVAVAGAIFKTVGTNDAQGAAYIFEEPRHGWRLHEPETAEITASDGQAENQFGYSVSINGGSLMVGAPYANINGNLAQGAAYLFLQPKGYWKSTNVFSAKLSASNGAAGASFGTSVANNSSTLMVGADTAVVKGNPAQGEAYVFGP